MCIYYEERDADELSALFIDRLIMASPYYFPKNRSDAVANPELENFLIQNQVDEVLSLGWMREIIKRPLLPAVITFTKKTREELTRMYQQKGISAVESAEFISGKI